VSARLKRQHVLQRDAAFFEALRGNANDMDPGAVAP
jgi:hypothetical protein